MAVLMSYHKLVERDSKHVDFCWKCKKRLKSTILQYINRTFYLQASQLVFWC